jgi:hypothetical protein
MAGVLIDGVLVERSDPPKPDGKNLLEGAFARQSESCLANIRLANFDGHVSRKPQLDWLALAPRSTASEKV